MAADLEGRAAFLDRALAAIGAQPAVVATHHPWMPSGIAAMDALNLRNGAAMMARLEAHPGPVRMISGHVHRAMSGQIGRVTCQIAGAPCHAVAVDHQPDVAARLVMEPGTVTAFTWQPSCRVSDTIPTGTYAGPWPFDTRPARGVATRTARANGDRWVRRPGGRRRVPNRNPRADSDRRGGPAVGAPA